MTRDGLHLVYHPTILVDICMRVRLSCRTDLGRQVECSGHHHAGGESIRRDATTLGRQHIKCTQDVIWPPATAHVAWERSERWS